MATIKAYTDLEQSKKLAGFLPIESADMRFCFSHTLDGRTTGHYPMIGSEPSLGTIPCWSLAALLGVLPRVDIEKDMCSDYTYEYRVKAYIGDGYIGDLFDNPIDACVTMIERLNELKFL